MGSKYNGAFIIPSGTHVIYERLTDNEYWAKRQISAMDGISYSSIGGKMSLGAIGTNLINMANNERSKELALLRAAGFEVNDDIDLRNFIAKFNEITQGAEQYEKALNRLKFSLTKGIKNKSGTRAANISSFFMDTFSSILNRKIQKFLENASLATLPFATWTANFDRMAQEAIQESFKARFGSIQVSSGKQAYKNDLYGVQEDYVEIAQAYDSIQGLSGSFEQMLGSKLKNNLKALKQNIYDSVKKNNNTKDVRSLIDKKFSSRAKSVGGSVYEYFYAICSNIAASAGGVIKASSQVVSGEKVKTDVITVYSYDGQLNAEDLTTELNKELSSNTKLSEAAGKIDNILSQKAFNLDKNFIIYTSNKMYNLGGSFSIRGFGGLGSMPIGSMLDFLQASGVSLGATNINSFLTSIYNAMSGAILEKHQGDIQEDIANLVAQAVAKLLFDDWNQIGVSQANSSSIHVFALSGVNVPYSFFLNTLGETLNKVVSMADAGSIVNVSISFGSVTDKTKTMHGSDDKVKPAVYQAWGEQLQAAQDQIKVSVKFLASFENLLAQL